MRTASTGTLVSTKPRSGGSPIATGAHPRRPPRARRPGSSGSAPRPSTLLRAISLARGGSYPDGGTVRST
jgi:hypothetical protein